MSDDLDPEAFLHSERFPIKPPTTYVLFQRWPEDGNDWIHPEDRGLEEGLIPSDFVFRRDLIDDHWYRLSYGDVSIRIRSVLFEEVAPPVFEIGQLVELNSSFDARKPGVGRVYAIRYNLYHRQAVYYLIRGDLKSETPYLATDLRPFEKEDWSDEGYSMWD
ncbi:MAG: hypothetical protein WDZ51_02825 [Pirellulaceae bacterium]